MSALFIATWIQAGDEEYREEYENLDDAIAAVAHKPASLLIRNARVFFHALPEVNLLAGPAGEELYQKVAAHRRATEELNHVVGRVLGQVALLALEKEGSAPPPPNASEVPDLRETAAQMFNVDPGQVTTEQRSAARAATFGMRWSNGRDLIRKTLERAVRGRK